MDAQATNFIVRLIYIQPTDVVYDKTNEARILEFVGYAQEAYASEMANHGFGSKTFRLERDAKGDALLRVVKVNHRSEYYTTDTWSKLLLEIPDSVNPTIRPWSKQDHVHLFIIGGVEVVDRYYHGFARAYHAYRAGGYTVIAKNSLYFDEDLVFRQLKHAFGLYHHKAREWLSLDYYEARWLDKHYHFNNRKRVEWTYPTVDLDSVKLTATSTDMIEMEFIVNAKRGLHQVMVFNRKGGTMVIAYSYLNGEKTGKGKLDISRADWERELVLAVMDMEGNFRFVYLLHNLPNPIIEPPSVEPPSVEPLENLPEPIIEEPRIREPRTIVFEYADGGPPVVNEGLPVLSAIEGRAEEEEEEDLRRPRIYQCPIGWMPVLPIALIESPKVIVKSLEIQRMESYTYKPIAISIYSEELKHLEGWSLWFSIPMNLSGHFANKHKFTVDNSSFDENGILRIPVDEIDADVPMIRFRQLARDYPGFDYRLYDDKNRRIDAAISCYFDHSDPNRIKRTWARIEELPVGAHFILLRQAFTDVVRKEWSDPILKHGAEWNETRHYLSIWYVPDAENVPAGPSLQWSGITMWGTLKSQ
jgi:hypothetical protein